ESCAFSGSEIDAAALLDVVILVVEPDAALTLHHVDQLVLVGGIRRKAVRALEPTQRALHILGAAQGLVQHFGDFTFAGHRLLRQLVGIDKCQRHDYSLDDSLGLSSASRPCRPCAPSADRLPCLQESWS